jgi:hypothetical protein
MVGGVSTVTVAALLVAVPTGLVAVARNFKPLKSPGPADTVSVPSPTLHAPFERFVHVVPPFDDACQQMRGDGTPAAATVNTAFCPGESVWFAGCVVNTGAVSGAANWFNRSRFLLGSPKKGPKPPPISTLPSG